MYTIEAKLKEEKSQNSRKGSASNIPKR